MHFYTTAITLALAAAVSAGQVNFYSDSNCQNYMDSRFPGANQITGGPAGARSALWVSGDQTTCSRTCGPWVICGDSSCGRRRETAPLKCVGFSSGVWARNGCGGDQCGNA